MIVVVHLLTATRWQTRRRRSPPFAYNHNPRGRQDRDDKKGQEDKAGRGCSRSIVVAVAVLAAAVCVDPRDFGLGARVGARIYRQLRQVVSTSIDVTRARPVRSPGAGIGAGVRGKEGGRLVSAAAIVVPAGADVNTTPT